MTRYIGLALAAFALAAIPVAAQQTITLSGGVMMELQDSYAVSANGLYGSYYQAISPTISLGGSAGYVSTKNGWYAPLASGIQFRPNPLGVSPVLGFEVGTSFLSTSTSLESSDNPMILSPQVGLAVPLARGFELRLATRADVMTRNGDWWGFLSYGAGLGYSW